MTARFTVMQEISQRFADERDYRDRALWLRMRVDISKSIDACGLSHVGGIGILGGVEKNGEEFYPDTVGGRADGACRTRYAGWAGGSLI